jgi:hypothetical protein
MCHDGHIACCCHFQFSCFSARRPYFLTASRVIEVYQRPLSRDRDPLLAIIRLTPHHAANSTSLTTCSISHKPPSSVLRADKKFHPAPATDSATLYHPPQAVYSSPRSRCPIHTLYLQLRGSSRPLLPLPNPPSVKTPISHLSHDRPPKANARGHLNLNPYMRRRMAPDRIPAWSSVPGRDPGVQS